MKHKDVIGSMYFVLGYAACIAVMFEGEYLYQKFFALAYGSYLTWHIVNQYEN
jgi:hypothetical protein